MRLRTLLAIALAAAACTVAALAADYPTAADQYVSERALIEPLGLMAK